MSYLSDSYFTRKQCNVIYRAFKTGQLNPPKDCRGKVKSPGFVYSFEGQAYIHGFFLDKDEILLNGQLRTLHQVVNEICAGNLDAAQALLDGTDPRLVNFFADDQDFSKMWKVVTSNV